MHLQVHTHTCVHLYSLVQYMWLSTSYGHTRTKSSYSLVLLTLRQYFLPTLGSSFPTTAHITHLLPLGPSSSGSANRY